MGIRTAPTKPAKGRTTPRASKKAAPSSRAGAKRGATVDRLMKKTRQSAKEDALTERETEALTWTARGKSRASIAELMNITTRTVVFHLKRAQKRLGAMTCTQAAVKAAMLGLIEP